MAVKFCSIASGSDGNSTFVGTGNTNILIDAGLSGKKIEEGLKSAGIDIFYIDGIFITHEHSDHIQGAGVLSRRYDIPLFATEETWLTMEGTNSLGKIKHYNRRVIYKGENTILNDLKILPFEIPHDAADPVGYSITAQNKKISVATDLGHITDCIKENISDSDILLIEANHDLDRLWNGPYPWPLKKRINGDFGHLSNDNCGKLLTEIMSKKLRHVFLGHLSKENNIPLLAFETVKNILEENKISVGQDLSLNMAHRGRNTTPLVLE